jgi:hypothetical protein
VKRGGAADDYRAWKNGVATEMERLHCIAAGVIPEHVWTRFYVRGMSPEEAAKATELQNYFTKEPGERLARAKRSPEQS